MPLLFAYGKNEFSYDIAQIMYIFVNFPVHLFRPVSRKNFTAAF